VAEFRGMLAAPADRDPESDQRAGYMTAMRAANAGASVGMCVDVGIVTLLLISVDRAVGPDWRRRLY
jgi:hypothetical protein